MIHDALTRQKQKTRKTERLRGFCFLMSEDIGLNWTSR